MIRPSSIIRFEQLYWASFVIGLINTATSWTSRAQVLAANPVLANATWFLPAVTVVSIAVAVTLWYFIARTPSVVAKWVQVVFAGVGAISTLLAVVTVIGGRAPALLPVVLGIVANLLYIAAAVMLFRPDAKEWFGEDREDDLDDLDRPTAPTEPFA
ncbi:MULTISPECIES: hypothetical protein [unclassified Sphingomonas]|uniref:hypothetical protein n=1 Tax=unclassified Sphingomonas TaxID=196159 RepID=UPI002269D871|nr:MULTISPECIES: hypothetical protein [unclassified Sphingomonas]